MNVQIRNRNNKKKKKKKEMLSAGKYDVICAG